MYKGSWNSKQYVPYTSKRAVCKLATKPSLNCAGEILRFKWERTICKKNGISTNNDSIKVMSARSAVGLSYSI